jgi:hypothetical protein
VPISVSVTDNVNSLNSSNQNTATVAAPVTLTNPGTQDGTEGTAFSSLTLSASGSGTLTFEGTGLPPGLYLAPTTGVISGTPAIGAAGGGPYTPIITVTNGDYSASQQFTFNISSPVILTAPSNQTTSEGATIATLDLSASDSIEDSTLTYAAVGLPPGLSINTSNGHMTGTVAVGAAADGPYAVTVIATDNTYSASQTFQWVVTCPVSIGYIPDQTTTEGTTIATLSISASDTSDGTLVFSGTGLPTGLKVNSSTGAITGTVAAGAGASGSPPSEGGPGGGIQRHRHRG